MEQFNGMLTSVECSASNLALTFKDDATFAYAQKVWDWVNGADNHSFVHSFGVSLKQIQLRAPTWLRHYEDPVIDVASLYCAIPPSHEEQPRGRRIEAHLLGNPRLIKVPTASIDDAACMAISISKPCSFTPRPTLACHVPHTGKPVWPATAAQRRR